MDSNFEKYMRREQIGCENAMNFEYRKWCNELPELNFNSEWLVKIIPPFGNAIVRFIVKDKEKKHNCSVYFDAYDSLGYVGQPYWEMYDGEDCTRYCLGEEDEMMRDIANVLSK